MKSQHMFTALAAAMLSLGAYSTAANAADLANCTVCHSNITKAHAAPPTRTSPARPAIRGLTNT